MITKDLLKEEIDGVQDHHLEILYRIIRALTRPPDSVELGYLKASETLTWEEFIQTTYGCLADDPIKRSGQGQYEVREDIR